MLKSGRRSQMSRLLRFSDECSIESFHFVALTTKKVQGIGKIEASFIAGQGLLQQRFVGINRL